MANNRVMLSDSFSRQLRENRAQDKSIRSEEIVSSIVQGKIVNINIFFVVATCKRE